MFGGVGAMDSTKLKKMIIILVGVFLVLTIVIVSQLLKPKKPGLEAQTVLVSTVEVAKGSRLSNKVTRWVRYEKKDVKSDYFTQADLNGGKLQNYMVVNDIPTGSVINDAMVLKIEKSGDYAAYIAPGKLAVPISVAYTPESLNVVQPGDRVDIIFTFRTEDKTGEGTLASRVVGQNVPVLSVSDKATGSLGGFFGGKSMWLVVELSQDQATRMTVYQSSGRLSIVLKSTTNTRTDEQGDYQPYSSNQLDKEVGVIYGN